MIEDSVGPSLEIGLIQMGKEAHLVGRDNYGEIFLYTEKSFCMQFKIL